MRTLLAALLLFSVPAFARDAGQWEHENPTLHNWFDGLKSGKGLCCSFADGVTVRDPDWGTEAMAGADGKQTIVYWVVIDGQKYDVPPEAVVTEPNKFGAAVVWPYQDYTGKTKIRCFIAGAQG